MPATNPRLLNAITAPQDCRPVVGYFNSTAVIGGSSVAAAVGNLDTGPFAMSGASAVFVTMDLTQAVGGSLIVYLYPADPDTLAIVDDIPAGSFTTGVVIGGAAATGALVRQRLDYSYNAIAIQNAGPGLGVPLAYNFLRFRVLVQPLTLANVRLWVTEQ